MSILERKHNKGRWQTLGAQRGEIYLHQKMVMAKTLEFQTQVFKMKADNISIIQSFENIQVIS